jgi:hypothetical protein
MRRNPIVGSKNVDRIYRSIENQTEVSISYKKEQRSLYTIEIQDRNTRLSIVF